MARSLAELCYQGELLSWYCNDLWSGQLQGVFLAGYSSVWNLQFARAVDWDVRLGGVPAQDGHPLRSG